VKCNLRIVQGNTKQPHVKFFVPQGRLDGPLEGVHRPQLVHLVNAAHVRVVLVDNFGLWYGHGPVKTSGVAATALCCLRCHRAERRAHDADRLVVVPTGHCHFGVGTGRHLDFAAGGVFLGLDNDVRGKVLSVRSNRPDVPYIAL
jgi:hypothetical protein